MAFGTPPTKPELQDYRIGDGQSVGIGTVLQAFIL
jgi:hypothetical protein